MNDTWPKVSIIIPVYNGSDFLQEAIESALAQDYPNKEVIVINDGSQDDGKTAQIIASYAGRIRSFYQENAGVAAALNLGIDQMTGEYFSWLSHDDLYYPNKLSSEMALIREGGNPNLIVYSGYKQINAEGKLIGEFDPSKMYDLSRYDHPLFPVMRLLVNGCTLMCHRAHFMRVGGFNIALRTTQDYDMWFRLFRGQSVKFCPIMGVASRQHPGQGSRQAIQFHVSECETLWLGMLGSLNEEEINSIDENAYTFYKNTYVFLAQRTLYKQTIHYCEVEALKHLGYLSKLGSTYQKLEKDNQKEKDHFFNGELHIHSALACKELFNKRRQRVAFFINKKNGQGGLMKMLLTVAKGLTRHFEVFVFCSGEEIKSYEKEDDLIYLQIIPRNDWQKVMSRFMVTLGIDVFIGCHNCLAFLMKLYETLQDYGIKCIAWNHEDYFFTREQKAFNDIGESRKATFHKLEAVVWNNKASKVVYSEEADNGICIPNCIEKAKTAALNVEKIPYQLIAAGRFEDSVKRFDRVLEVFAKVLEKYPMARLFVASEIDLQTRLEVLDNKTVEEWMALSHMPKESISFLGWTLDIELYYEKAMLQLCCSQSEGFGMVILEAAQHGVPTIAFSNGGADSIWGDGENG